MGERLGKTGILAALASAILFGASTPFAKSLLVDLEPLALAGVLYLGAGIGLTILTAINRLARGPQAAQPSAHTPCFAT